MQRHILLTRASLKYNISKHPVTFLPGAEKLNDVCCRIHLQKPNKWDLAKDVLLLGKRPERLENCKKVEEYWAKGNMQNM